MSLGLGNVGCDEARIYRLKRPFDYENVCDLAGVLF
jgi:hypothetical protein